MEVATKTTAHFSGHMTYIQATVVCEKKKPLFIPFSFHSASGKLL